MMCTKTDAKQRGFILAFLVIIISSGCTSSKQTTAQPKNIQLDVKSAVVLIYSKGKNVSEKPYSQETVAKQQLEKWWAASSQKIGTSDFNSYAPDTVLRTNQIKINFQKSRTIISIKKETDPKSSWKQYSRKPTAEDTMIREFCMQKNS